jgi:raffinose/stachyose/melibiose transport system substrate-binding protein
MTQILSWLRQYFAVLVVALTFLWSAVAIVSYRQKEAPPGTTVTLRIGHWQLEAGVRDGINQIAAEYHKLHPEVSIVQDAVPEGTYGSWLVTQLMGGTAPDIIEPGMVWGYVLLSMYNRYFIPITPYVNQPNPYNAGTSLEGVPWRKTFKDGMRGGYVEELQEYMNVPLSQFGIRIFYNQDLLKKLTGLDQAPHDYRGFLAACKRISEQKNAKGQPYTPIAGSGYHIGMWDQFMCEPLTYGAVRLVDFNRDGAVGNDELFVGMKTGRISMQYPGYEARFRMLHELTQYFQAGYTGLGRDEAVFLFAQQRAVFITTGTWDAGSLAEQAKGSFEVGVMDFPMPKKDDPEFASVIEGPVYERPQGGFPFAVTRTCTHPEVAVDFLWFLSSQKQNEELNRIIGWIPSVVGAKLNPMLEAFEPHLEGVYGAMPTQLGGETTIKWMQLFSLFQVNQISHQDLAKQFDEVYLKKGPEEFAEMQRNRRRTLASDEQFIAGFRARALLATGSEAHSLWINYRQLNSGRLVQRDLWPGMLRKILLDGPVTNAAAPYGFGPSVMKKIHERIAAEKEARN